MIEVRKREFAFFALGLLILALVVFRQVLAPGQLLFTTDDNVGALMMRKGLLPHGWWGGWNDQILLGNPALISLNLTNLLLFIFPAGFFNNWINAFDIIVGSIVLALFLRLRGVRWPACALGVLTVYWLGSNFTLIYAGHIGKFGILLWVAVFLWLTELAVQRQSLRYAVLAGGALGATFLEQADVAFFFALALGPFALFRWWQAFGRPDLRLVKFAVCLFGTAFLLSVHPLLSGYATAVEDVASVQEEDPQAKWEFITQWSWPPEESIDFIAPGFTGWRSGEPTGPYTGRMGRSAGWEETGQGFQNFKLENQYLGAIPLLFVAMALFLAFRRKRPEWTLRGDVLFWGGVTLIVLLLSFGKYFPLYALFYQLPIVSSIRNPNKFLQVFQFALGILAAYGMHEFLRQTLADQRNSLRSRDLKPLLLGAVLLGAILLVWGIGSMAAWDSLTDRFRQDGWGRLAGVVVENRVWALLHAGVMTFLGVGLIHLLAARRVPGGSVTSVSIWALVGLVVFDVLFLARHYVAVVDADTVEANEVTQLIQTDGSHSRTALVSQDGFYNQWLSYLFPYHQIKTINVAQMPRMPMDYQQYLRAVGGNPIRQWELGAVRFILGPAQIWSQIANEPTLRDQFELVFAYNTEPIDGGARVIPASEAQPGQHVVLRHRAPHSRYALVTGWEVVDDTVALTRLAAPTHVPFEQVLVSPEHADRVDLPESEGRGVSGRVQRVAYRPGYVELRVSAEDSSILRVAEKYDAHWKAEVNGVPTPLLRVDYLAQGVYLDAGVHKVTLRYAPPKMTLWFQAGGMGLVLVVLLLMMGERFARARSPSES